MSAWTVTSCVKNAGTHLGVKWKRGKTIKDVWALKDNCRLKLDLRTSFFFQGQEQNCLEKLQLWNLFSNQFLTFFCFISGSTASTQNRFRLDRYNSLECAVGENVTGVSEVLERRRGSKDQDPCSTRSLLVVSRVTYQESFACVGK